MKQTPLATLLATARNRVHSIPPHNALSRLDQWLVIDVREPGETLYGYLPFAINVPRGQLEFHLEADRTVTPSRHILVYSNTGRRSLLAAQTLVQLGFDRVSSLDGGIERWVELGLPLE